LSISPTGYRSISLIPPPLFSFCSLLALFDMGWYRSVDSHRPSQRADSELVYLNCRRLPRSPSDPVPFSSLVSALFLPNRRQRSVARTDTARKGGACSNDVGDNNGARAISNIATLLVSDSFPRARKNGTGRSNGTTGYGAVHCPSQTRTPPPVSCLTSTQMDCGRQGPCR